MDFVRNVHHVIDHLHVPVLTCLLLFGHVARMLEKVDVNQIYSMPMKAERSLKRCLHYHTCTAYMYAVHV